VQCRKGSSPTSDVTRARDDAKGKDREEEKFESMPAASEEGNRLLESDCGMYKKQVGGEKGGMTVQVRKHRIKRDKTPLKFRGEQMNEFYILPTKVRSSTKKIDRRRKK